MLSRSEIQKSIKSKSWQTFRESLKGESTRGKLILLKHWRLKHHNSKNSQVQVENYTNALKRAGLI